MCASVATAHGGDDYFAHPGSVGRAAPTVELKIVGDDDREMPTGEPGEIWIKGPNVMARGYWNRPEATAAAVPPDEPPGTRPVSHGLRGLG